MLADSRHCARSGPYFAEPSIGEDPDGVKACARDHPGMYQRPLFRDRVDAGRILAQALLNECEPDAVVIGLARGGIEVAAEVARALDLPLDAVAVRKIRHPAQPEYALGAVTPADGVYLRSANGLTDDEIATAMALARDEAEQLDRRLHADLVPLDVSGRQAIVVDDGLATAATMIAAVRWARGRGAAQVVAATPVASTEGVALLRNEADQVVCPYKLARFGAVGFWYHDFDQVSDEKAIRLLAHGSTGDDRAGS